MPTDEKPIITVITASWDREKYLKKLGDSLIKQSFQNFEWIVANDGSKDNTDEVVKSIAEKAKFKITYIKSSLRIGKSKMDNLMMKRVKGEYFTSCGSDDILCNDALENLYNLTKKIPENEKDDYVGIFANSIDLNGVSQTFANNKKINHDEHLYWEDIKKIGIGDGTTLEQFKFLKNKQYLEVDFLITESSLYDKIYKKKKFIVSNKVVKIMDRSAKNSISFGKKLRYCRGSAYCIAEIENINEFNSHNLFQKIKLIINYWRYSIHGEIIFFEAKKMLEPVNRNIFYSLLYPISYFICLRDILLNKVEKTHIEFNNNIKKTEISVKIFN